MMRHSFTAILLLSLLIAITTSPAYACDFPHIDDCFKELGNEIDHTATDVGDDIADEFKEIEDATVSEISTIVNTIKKDVEIVADEVVQIGEAVVTIEQKIVHFTENFVMGIINGIIETFWFIIYTIAAIIIVIIAAKSLQFAVWLRSILKQNSMEHLAQQQVKQNKEIIKLLHKIAAK